MANDNFPIWSVHDVYVQANVIHGYRYLDLCGGLLNLLSDRYRQVNLISPGGTSLFNPLDMKDPFEIQFESGRIWLHYVGTEAVQKVEKTAPEMIKSIAEKLGMKEFNRYGVRVRYFIATKNVLEVTDVVTKKLVSPSIAEVVANRRLDVQTSLEIPLIFKDLEVILRFRRIVITNPPISPLDYDGDGLLLDIDVGQRSDTAAFSRHDLAKLMSQAVQAHAELLVEYGQPLLQGVEL